MVEHDERVRICVRTTRDVGSPFAVPFHGKIVELDFLADPKRLRLLDLTILDD